MVAGDRVKLDLVNLKDLTVLAKVLAAHEPVDDLHHLIHALAALLPRNLCGEKILRPGTDSHTETETIAYHDPEARQLFRNYHGLANRQLYH